MNPVGPYNNSGQYGNVNRPSFFPGRIVNDIKEISPQDVPPDGSVAVFVLSDFSSIFVQNWTKDGTIATRRYVPEQALQAVASQQGSTSEVFQNQILRYLDSIEKKLSRPPYKSNYHKPPDRQERSNNGP